MITIKSLTKTYGIGGKAVHALNGIDLEIGSGMFGLLGPNGAGKTTFMRILAGIVNPSSGSIRVDGHDLTTEAGKQAVKSMLGYLPQELGMYPELSAEQFVDYMAILKGLDDPQKRSQRVETGAGNGRVAGGRPAQDQRLFGRDEAPRRHRPGAGQRPEAAHRR